MPHIHYITATGERRGIDARPHSTVMQVALESGITGILGDCGGACQCCTCHVYVDEAWLEKLPPMDDMEDAMLDSTAEPRRANSRLGCMLPMDATLDGLVVTLPASQI